MEWKEYYRSVKLGLFHFTHLRLLKWNSPNFTLRYYSSHSTLSHSMFIYSWCITNLWKFELNQSSKLCDNYERKNTLVAPWSHKVVCFQMLDFETSKSEVSKWKSGQTYFFLKNYVTSEGAACFNVYTINLPLLLVTK